MFTLFVPYYLFIFHECVVVQHSSFFELLLELTERLGVKKESLREGRLVLRSLLLLSLLLLLLRYFFRLSCLPLLGERLRLIGEGLLLRRSLLWDLSLLLSLLGLLPLSRVRPLLSESKSD